MESIQQVIDRFDFQGKTADCRAFGNGHINTTYIITTDLPEGGQQRYVLQKVNHNVFRDIDRLMQNVFAVTSFLQEKIRAAGGDPDRETLLASLPEHGVGLVVNPGCTVASSRTAVELAHRFPHIYAAVGIHPENCGDFRPEHLTEIRALAQEDKVVAIGEIGLDYYWPENPPRDLQQQVLRQQLALAQELQLPVIIHDRDAHADTMDIVREFPRVRGVFHCFAGSVEMARELVDRGWYLSFNGAATFKNARKAPEVIRAVPMERLMIETDAPYLTPVPYRGRRNDSTYVHLVAERIAQLRDMTPAAVEQATWDNGKGFFGI